VQFIFCKIWASGKNASHASGKNASHASGKNASHASGKNASHYAVQRADKTSANQTFFDGYPTRTP
jgi:hypothetical protein